MFIQPALNTEANNILVTDVATDIFSLMNTAGATSSDRAGFAQAVNGINITVTDGDIRLTYDDNIPTSTEGILLSTDNVAVLRNIALEDLKIISVSGNVTCSVALGVCEESEVSNIYSNSGYIPTVTPIDHADLTNLDADSSGHTGYALVDHTHDEYSPTSHDHDANYLKLDCSNSLTGNLSSSGKGEFSEGIKTKNSIADVSVLPTADELNTAFGTPAAVGAGFVSTLNDNNESANFYLITSDGSNWWYSLMTKAL